MQINLIHRGTYTEILMCLLKSIHMQQAVISVHTQYTTMAHTDVKESLLFKTIRVGEVY